MDLSTALALIDEYIAQLEDWQVSGAFSARYRSFENWLREYGCTARQITAIEGLVDEATGYSPEAIASLEDAQTVKIAIEGVCYSEVVGRRKKPSELGNPAGWARDHVAWGFGLSGYKPPEWEEDADV